MFKNGVRKKVLMDGQNPNRKFPTATMGFLIM
uniref:Uncharacterized protein n=1 Tax=Rhizophora mucronata TaxID=61149 RepID=A0A2P2Q2A9_RHIMU